MRAPHSPGRWSSPAPCSPCSTTRPPDPIMSDDETPDRDLTYAGEYSRRRYAEDPEFRARRRETNPLYYQRRKGDPAFVAAMRERNQVNTERRAAARAAAPVTARSAERRGGKECDSTGRYRGLPCH